MASVRFYLRSENGLSQIYARFFVRTGNELYSKTGLKIDAKDWNSTKSAPKQINKAEIKNLSKNLRELENSLLNSFNEDYPKGIIFTSDWLKEKINLFFNRVDEKEDDNIFVNYLKNFIEFKKSASTHTECTMRKYNNLKDRFSEFQKKKKKVFIIQEINAQVLLDFKKYLISDCNLMETTATRFIKNLKTVIFDARYNGKQINHQIAGFNTGTTNSEYKVFLSFEEIEKIRDVQTIDKDLKIAQDWLVLGCYLGQRASDLLRMNKKMIYTKTDSEGNSYRFIEITQQKTGEIVVIPLHEEVEKILKNYDGDFPPKFADNPDSNSVLFNRHLKKVCEIAGIHDLIKGKVYNEIEKKNEIIETEKCNLVSSHVCRRSFATNFYGNKMFTTPQLMAITGHKSEAMFLNYIGKTADDWAMQTAKTFKELSNQKSKIS